MSLIQQAGRQCAGDPVRETSQEPLEVMWTDFSFSRKEKKESTLSYHQGTRKRKMKGGKKKRSREFPKSLQKKRL